MKVLSSLIAAVAMVGASAALGAVSNAVVDGVQMPAWLERDGVRTPLMVGTAVRENDRIVSGMGSRILVVSEDGSLIKLGEHGTLVFRGLSRSGEDGNVLKAALEVLSGAFRFTTKATSSLRKREVSVKIRTLTLGIRGTDVWGKTDDERDVVCLIKGNITLQRGDDAPFTMKDPLTFYIAPRDKPVLPVAPVSAKQLKQWAKETEIEKGKGAARVGGKWKVNLAIMEDEEPALAILNKSRDAGYPAEIHSETRGQRRYYKVTIAHLYTRQDAQILSDRISTQLGIGTLPVSSD